MRKRYGREGGKGREEERIWRSRAERSWTQFDSRMGIEEDFTGKDEKMFDDETP